MSSLCGATFRYALLAWHHLNIVKQWEYRKNFIIIDWNVFYIIFKMIWFYLDNEKISLTIFWKYQQINRTTNQIDLNDLYNTAVEHILISASQIPISAHFFRMTNSSIQFMGSGANSNKKKPIIIKQPTIYFP